MQNAETVLSVLRERGRRGLPCNELYRQWFNQELFLLAYGRLYSNHGAMTPGVDGQTVSRRAARRGPPARWDRQRRRAGRGRRRVA